MRTMNENEIIKKCSLRLKEALYDNSLRAIDLAEKTGLKKSTISHYTTGVRVPTRDNAAAMGKVLGVNPAWLMGFDVSKYVDTSNKEEEHLELLLTYFAQLTSEQQESVINLVKNMV